jgi:cytoskeleton protein RodZ
MTETVHAAVATPGEPGSQLRAEREKRGMSLQKAADELHLDAWVIESLESGDYRRIGPTVYVKGHLKRYAGLLGLPASAIMAAYETHALAPSVVTATPIGGRLGGRLGALSEAPQLHNLSPSRIAGGLIALLVLLGVMWWKPWHQRGPAPASNAPSAVIQQPTTPNEEDSASLALTASAAPERENSRNSAGGAATTPTLAVSPDASSGVTAGAGRAKLRLSFSADSWVDVHDAQGRRAYAGNGLANSVKTIAGVAPMRVYLGAGSGVQLEINDRVVAIGPQFFAGDVARFEAGADGVLRRDQAHAAPSSSAQTRNARPPG